MVTRGHPLPFELHMLTEENWKAKGLAQLWISRSQKH